MTSRFAGPAGAEVDAVSGADPPPGPSLTGPGAADRFALLFDEHAPGLWRFLARQVGAGPAEDVVAETFLTAWSARDAYRPDRGSARAWLFGIAVNLLRRLHRNQAQQQRTAQRLSAQVRPVGGPEDGVAERVDARADVAGLATAIAALPGGDREVLLMNSLAGLSTREIATALGIPEGTVRSRLHRVRRGLRAVAAADASKGES